MSHIGSSSGVYILRIISSIQLITEYIFVMKDLSFMNSKDNFKYTKRNRNYSGLTLVDMYIKDGI